MAHNTEVYLRLFGAADELIRFEAAAKGRDDQGRPTPLSFESLRPSKAQRLVADDCPDCLKYQPAANLEILAEVPGHRQATVKRALWRMGHWGTLEDPGDVSVSRTGKQRIGYSFETAVPPLNLLMDISKRFPTIGFDLMFFAPTRGVGGHVMCLAGRPVLSPIFQGDRTAFISWAQAEFRRH